MFIVITADGVRTRHALQQELTTDASANGVNGQMPRASQFWGPCKHVSA